MCGKMYNYPFGNFPYFDLCLRDSSKVTLITHDNPCFDNSKTNIIDMKMFNEHGEYPGITDKLCKILAVARYNAFMTMDLKHKKNQNL